LCESPSPSDPISNQVTEAEIARLEGLSKSKDDLHRNAQRQAEETRDRFEQDYKRKIATNQALLETTQSRLDALEAQHHTLQIARDEMLAAHRVQDAQARKDLAALQGLVSGKESEVTALEVRMLRKEGEVTRQSAVMHAEMARHEGESESLKGKLRKAEGELVTTREAMRMAANAAVEQKGNLEIELMAALAQLQKEQENLALLKNQLLAAETARTVASDALQILSAERAEFGMQAETEEHVLKAQLALAQDEKENALLQVSEIRSKLQGLTKRGEADAAELRQREAENIQLHAQVTAVTGALNKAKAEVVDREEAKQNMQADLLIKTRQMEQQVIQERSELDARVADLERVLENTKRERDDLQRVRGSLESQMLEARASHQQKLVEMKEIKEVEMKEMKEEMEVASTAAENARSVIVSQMVAQVLKGAIEEQEELRRQLAESEAKANTLDVSIKARNRDLQRVTGDTASQIAELKGQVAELENVAGGRVSEIAQARFKLAESEGRANARSAEMQTLTARIVELENTQGMTANASEALLKRVADMEKMKDAQLAEIQTLKAGIVELERTQVMTANGADASLKQVADLQNMKDAQLAEIQTLKARIMELERTQVMTANESEALMKQVADMEKMKAGTREETMGEIRTLQEAVEAARASAAQAQVADMEKMKAGTREEMMGEIRTFQEAAEAAQASANELTTQKAELEQEVARVLAEGKDAVRQTSVVKKELESRNALLQKSLVTIVEQKGEIGRLSLHLLSKKVNTYLPKKPPSLPMEVVSAEFEMSKSLEMQESKLSTLSEEDKKVLINARMLLEQYADLHSLEAKRMGLLTQHSASRSLNVP
jgi:chromosome segregation ATPase